MKIIDNIKDIKRILEIKDLLEFESIKVDIISLKSSFLNIDPVTYMFIKNCYVCDKNYNLECNLTDEFQIDLYMNFNRDTENFNRYIENEIGCDNLKYLKYIEIGDNTQNFNKTYRIQEKIEKQSQK